MGLTKQQRLIKTAYEIITNNYELSMLDISDLRIILVKLYKLSLTKRTKKRKVKI